MNRDQILSRMQEIHDGAEADGRKLTAEEAAEWDDLERRAKEAQQVEAPRRLPERSGSPGTSPGGAGSRSGLRSMTRSTSTFVVPTLRRS